jgi:hypothetical protein
LISGECPDFETFLTAPIEDVRKVAPTTMIYAPAGTRRDAALAGIPARGDAFADWTQKRFFACLELIFHLGVRNLFVPMLGPSQFEEVTADYREHLWAWFESGIAGPTALDHFQRYGWRVRVAFSDFLPRLRSVAEKVHQLTPQDSPHTVWCIVTPAFDLPLQWMVEAINQSQAKTLEDAIRAIFGELIPPVELYLGSGKPLLSPFQIAPLLLRGSVECYWSQIPGYSLSEEQFRSILYDYACIRQTWRKDKTGRAAEALTYRDAWEKGPTIGLGTRLGPFWYPQTSKLTSTKTQESQG